MSTPYFSRYNRGSESQNPMTPGASSSRQLHTRASSPPLSTASYSQTATPGQQKLNVVTRVAIEGKAKQDKDGAAIKMYLKISLPLDSVTPGSTIPLFPEENVKVLTSQVHPIDNNSVPYNFSSTVSPLLHNAGRALNLPARSSQTYQSVFGLSPQPTTSSILRSSSTSKAAGEPAPLDVKYTGHILVSGYHISYVLPKEFPSRPRSEAGDGYSRSSSSKSRRQSIGEKNIVQFMAAIDMWVPYVSRPPRSPYLLSIPTPRCLHNNIKLRIFPPNSTSTSSSFASLSSSSYSSSFDSWELSTDPHVTRSASSRVGRTNSSSQFADDESSDSSTKGFADGYGIQGTFPSAERIRVRWARPMRGVDVGGVGGADLRGRVGVQEAKGEMSCLILGKASGGGALMHVEYKGTCKGVWFSGVATLLGLDIGLAAQGADVAWAPGQDARWTVNGGVGYTGWDVGAAPILSRQSSMDSTGPQIFEPKGNVNGVLTQNSASSSTASLLRAPLPVAQNIAEYSFEGPSSSAPSSTASSMASLPTSSAPNLLAPSPEATTKDSDSAKESRPPGVPITLHLNMNELVPPVKNTFTFTVSGTIVVTPRPRLRSQIHSQSQGNTKYHNLNSLNPSPANSDGEEDAEPVILPRFTVLAADAETTATIVRNDIDSVGGNRSSVNVEVYSAMGDVRDAQSRKTVLSRGASTRCGDEGGRIILRAIRPASAYQRSLSPGARGSLNGYASSRPRTPNGSTPGLSRISSPASIGQMLPSMSLRPKRDGPLMIPSVMATVTLINTVDDDGDKVIGYGYAVRVVFNVPADGEEWVEFGLAQAGPVGAGGTSVDSESDPGGPPHVEIASTSVEGVPVRFESTAAAKHEGGEVGGVLFEEMSGKEWVSWVRVHVGPEMGGGDVVVDYVVRERRQGQGEKSWWKGKRRTRDVNVFLPTFTLPVGRLEVCVEEVPSFEIVSLISNLAHHQSLPHRRRMLHFSLEELFYPQLSLILYPTGMSDNHSNPPSTLSILLRGLISMSIPTLLSLVLLSCVLSLGTEFRHMRQSLESCSAVIGSGWNDPPQTVTVTTTVLASSHSNPNVKRWFGDTSSELSVPSALVPSSPPEASPAQPPSITSIEAPSSALTPSPARTHRPLPTLTATVIDDFASSVPAGDKHALLSIQNFPFPWPLRFDLPPIPPIARATVDKLLEGLGTVYQAFRKIYHYPLDPP